MECRNEIVFENEHLGALFAAIQNQKYTIRKQEFSSVLPALAVIQCRASASILDAKTSAAIQQIALNPGEGEVQVGREDRGHFVAGSHVRPVTGQNPMSLTPYHAKYFAHDLTRRAVVGIDRLSMSLFDAAVDLNPHQIEAALFALESPLSKGVILADEVGLGKTIEAGIVLCQLWAERKRRLLVICPASLRKQWALELEEKFNLPTRVLDSKSYRDEERQGRTPLAEPAILIMSFNYANAMREELKPIAWDMVVVDEAHKLRNAYRPSNKVGQGIRWATEDCRKLLLTATPASELSSGTIRTFDTDR